MSMRYKGSVLSATPPTTSLSSASGAWTLEQQLQAQSAGAWPRPPIYIEDYFSTYLYTGTGATQTITTGLNMSGQGGLTWIKSRQQVVDHGLFDTMRGANSFLSSNTTTAATSATTDTLTAFTTSGFTLGSNGSGGTKDVVNRSGFSYVSWSFREAPRFFDVVTYTGDGVAGRQISHSLGVAPGFFVVKRINTTGEWWCYHQSLGASKYIVLNQTAQAYTDTAIWNNTAPTSTVFTVGDASEINAAGNTYVAYLFAHDTASDGVIQCGSFTTDGSGNASVTLGWEPQWVLAKASGATNNWIVADNMRGMPAAPASAQLLFPNLSDAEVNAGVAYNPTATGFTTTGGAGPTTFIYIAIRRGPMRTPTSGTSVFEPVTSSSSTVGQKLTTGFPVDMQMSTYTGGTSANAIVVDRLRGVSTTTTQQGNYVITSSTAAEASTFSASYFWDNTGYGIPTVWAGSGQVYWNFRRAPGFFDEVCYTGTGVYGRTLSHNLGAAPELMIVKQRSLGGASRGWAVYAAPIGATNTLQLQSLDPSTANDWFANTAPTASVFSVGSNQIVNESGQTFVAYLFASCPGVSKVGSYTGNGGTQTINCGFAGGARFVLIKRTDSIGGPWFVWDTARGMVAGTDPRLALNNSDPQVNQNYVYTTTTGFQLVTSNDNVNTAGGSYIFLAIA